MKNNSHKRNNPRYEQSITIELSRFSESKRLLSARVENYCETGACLLSPVALKKGDILIIRKKNSTEVSYANIDPDCNFEIMSTEVVWCNTTQQDRFPYRIGVKRMLPYF